MKVSAVALVALAQVACAHYIFDTNIINGEVQRPWQYIREPTRQTKYNPIKFSSNPPQDIRDNSFADGDDIRCNQGAFSSAGRTEVLTVNAGDEVRFRLAYGARMEHPGPALVYMSRAPGDNVKAYDGSGDWFKIFQEGVCHNDRDFTTDAWCTWGRDWIAARIPQDTPNGEYLVRVEHIGVHRSHENQPEHYTTCMQVRVQNGGNGSPGPTVKFPGAYKNTDFYAKMSVWTPNRDFVFPGPPVWTGGNGGGSGANNNNNSGGGSNDLQCAPMWGQCGGQGFNGPKCCSSGTCRAANQWYSQCV